MKNKKGNSDTHVRACASDAMPDTERAANPVMSSTGCDQPHINMCRCAVEAVRHASRESIPVLRGWFPQASCAMIIGLMFGGDDVPGCVVSA